MFFMKKYAAGTMLLVGMTLLIYVFGSSAEGALKGRTAKVDITPPIGAWLSGYGSRNKPSEGILESAFCTFKVLWTLHSANDLLDSPTVFVRNLHHM